MDGGHNIARANTVPGDKGLVETFATPVSLFVSVCSGRGWAGQFGYSLASFMLSVGFGMGDCYARSELKLPSRSRINKVDLVFSRQANIVASRNDHLLMARAQGHTHFLSLDDDMVFPPNCIDRMLAHAKPLVVANYRKKQQDKIACVCSGMDMEFLDSTGKTGLEQVLGFGMGLTLIDMKAIEHVPAPFFAVVWNATHSAFMIEDAVFASILREHNVTAWVDHDLSQEVGHVGDYEYRLPPISLGVPVPALLPPIL